MAVEAAMIQHRGAPFLPKVRLCALAKKHGPAIVRSVGGDGAVPRAVLGGRPDPKPDRAANLVDGHERLVPLRCKALYLLKIQDRRIGFAND